MKVVFLTFVIKDHLLAVSRAFYSISVFLGKTEKKEAVLIELQRDYDHLLSCDDN